MKENWNNFIDRKYDRFMWTDSLNNEHVFCTIDHEVLIELARAILNKIYKDNVCFQQLIKIPDGGLNINDIILDYAIPAACVVTDLTSDWEDSYLGIPSYYIVDLYQSSEYRFSEPMHSQILNLTGSKI